jgi:hypothetical protein
VNVGTNAQATKVQVLCATCVLSTAHHAPSIWRMPPSNPNRNPNPISALTRSVSELS